MALEDLTGTDKFIDDLINTNPVGATDVKADGDDHIRGIKNVLLNTFPNITGAVTASHTELSILDGATISTAELNVLDGATLSTAELNVLDGAVAGTQVASKAVVADSNINTGVSKVTELHVGATGSEVQMVSTNTANAPVTRDANGDFAANEITADLIGNADSATKVGVLNVKVIEIGDWDMDATMNKSVAHGLDVAKITGVIGVVFNDSGEGTGSYIISGFSNGVTEDKVRFLSNTDTNIQLTRTTGGFFDSVNFDSTSYNRGWVTIWYID
jgi:hypothetical protein